jgi:hypothetical protein
MSEKARHAVGGGVSGGVDRACLSARVYGQNTTRLLNCQYCKPLKFQISRNFKASRREGVML